MWSSKLKAFTLMEILISLVITSVVMLMASYAFNTVVKMSDNVRFGLSDSESSYFLLADLERQFKLGNEVTVRFNDVIFENVTFELGPEMIFRKQLGRTDTLNPLLLNPKLTGSIETSHRDYLLVDSLSFLSENGDYSLLRAASLADLINKKTRNGQDRP